MHSTVTGRNQVTIPAKVARRLGIERGSTLSWESTDQPDCVLVRVLPSRRQILERVSGAGQRWLNTGADPVSALIAERAEEGGQE